MNTKKATKILREQGYYVEKLSKKEFILGFSKRDQDCSVVDARNLISRARIYTSEGQKLPIKDNVKHFDKRRNRQRTNQAIHHEEFDKFPKGKIYKEDIWSWD